MICDWIYHIPEIKKEHILHRSPVCFFLYVNMIINNNNNSSSNNNNNNKHGIIGH